MVDGQATVFLSFHRTGEAEDFAAFAEEVGADAAAAPGFSGWRLSVLASPLLDWAIAVAFDDEGRLHQWLDRARGRLVGTRFPRLGMELFVDGVPHTPGVVLVRDVAVPGREEAFVATAEDLARAERAQPGYEGSAVFPPAAHQPHWASIIRFRTAAHLQAWLSSPELTRALPERTALLGGQTQVTTATSFGSTVQVAGGRAIMTPTWKIALMMQLILYPVVMLLARFVNPLLHALTPQPWLVTFLSLGISVCLLSWVLLPLVHRALARWLDPSASARVSALGVVAVGAGYAVLLAVFAVIPLLQV
ncbi:antibiotic biosynthesis monooxygenase [Microbacterium sp.]|uniref:antibiotic biosynthesis monooxygenase n=1 Tax=Microbacterium sp. TaxID=51671 RepID=UPI0039E61D12